MSGPRRCLWCGTTEELTKDHVISKVVARNVLGDKYPEFATRARGLQTQCLCGPCNNHKGPRVCDLRGDDERFQLIMLLSEYDILREIRFEKPEDVFPPKE